MRLTLRLMGLDVLDLNVETDGASDEPGDCTTYPVGYALPTPPEEFQVPDRGWDE